MAAVDSTLTERSATSGTRNPRIANTGNEAQASGVSWAAVIAGAVVAAALSLSLIVLGSGLGFSALSPWAGEGVSAEAIGIAGIVWLIFMHVIAGAMGGYLAGRLRVKWTELHTDEVYFRDTAHGFLVWAVSLVITATALVTASAAVIGGAAQAGASAAGAAVSAGGTAVAAGVDAQSEGEASGPIGYLADMLFRQDGPGATEPARADIRDQAVRILAYGWEDMPDADRTYLARLISQNTGITQAQAEARIDEVEARFEEMETRAREAADTARSVMAKLSLWMFLGLLIGAFSASFAATIGGRQRDSIHV